MNKTVPDNANPVQNYFEYYLAECLLQATRLCLAFQVAITFVDTELFALSEYYPPILLDKFVITLSMQEQPTYQTLITHLH